MSNYKTETKYSQEEVAALMDALDKACSVQETLAGFGNAAGEHAANIAREALVSELAAAITPLGLSQLVKMAIAKGKPEGSASS